MVLSDLGEASPDDSGSRTHRGAVCAPLLLDHVIAHILADNAPEPGEWWMLQILVWVPCSRIKTSQIMA